MPDVFTGAIVLCVFLLAWHGGMRGVTKLFVAGILALSVASHLSHVPLAILLLATALALKVFARRAFEARGPSIRSLIAWAGISTLAGIVMIPSLNACIGPGFVLAPARNTFLLARLMSDGLAKRYLREVCPQRGYVICAYLNEIPKTEDEFLYGGQFLSRMGGFNSKQIDEVVTGTLARYPVAFAADCARQTVRQFVSFDPGDEIRSPVLIDWNIFLFKRIFPGSEHRLKRSRQVNHTMLDVTWSFVLIQVAAFWVCLTVCVLLRRSRYFAGPNVFLYLICAFLLINAAISGTASGVFNRYQCRVAWLIPLCACVLLSAWICERVPTLFTTRNLRAIPMMSEVTAD
jgi:hypothetical protein